MGGFRPRFLIFVTITTILLAAQPVRANSANHAINDFDQLSALRDDYRTRKNSDQLRVNPRSEFRLIVPNKCERQGEVELQKLAATEILEESYVYIPSLCLWIEVGYGEARNRVRLDSKLIARLLHDVDQVIIYHIHVGAPARVAGYFPAYNDLLSMILINEDFLQNPEIKVSHRVVTKFGVISYLYQISHGAKQLIERINQTGLRKFAAQNLAYFYSNDKFKDRYYAKIRDCERLIDGHSEYLQKCFPMKIGDFLLEYQKLKILKAAGVHESGR